MKDSLINQVHRECGNYAKPNCKIVLKDVTRFEWERMYLFENWTTSDTIGKVIGFNYVGEDVPDQYWRMLFTYGNKVVYEEDNESLDYYRSSIEFEGAAESLFKGKAYSLTPSEAIFTVDKGKIEGECKNCYVYGLTPVGK